MTDKPLDQEEIDQAAADEQQALQLNIDVIMAEKAHLTQRVVVLRAELNRAHKRIEELENHQPKDRRPTKRTTKKPTPKKKT